MSRRPLVLGLTIDFDVVLARILDHDLNRALNLAIVPGPVLNRLLIRVVLYSLGSPRFVLRVLVRILIRDRNRILIRALDHVHESNRVLGRFVDIDVAFADALALARSRASAAAPPGTRVSPSAGWVAELAALMLPAADRLRWAEEFRSELYDIADSTSRRGQLAYALRLLGRGWELRSALVQAKRRTAGPG